MEKVPAPVLMSSYITMLLKWSYNLISFGFLAALLAGCAVTQSQKVPHKVLCLTDSEFNRDYYIYLPTSYGKHPVPLVVTCHGTNPWDSARLQINEWKSLAEENNFVVIAPVINSARGFIPPGPPEGTRILQEDERFILKITQRFLNNPKIDHRATMITGWSAGGFATYYIGLRHPDIFRVIAARQANFLRDYYPDDIPKFNPYQPILVFYGDGDLPVLKADAHAAYRFLKNSGQQNLALRSMAVGHTRHPEVALDFLMEAVKAYPQPSILSAKMYAGGKCRIKFDSGLVGPVDEENIFWDFGDGDSSPGKSVYHIYDRPGKYSLAVIYSCGGKVNRFTGQLTIGPDSIVIKPGVKK
jgi:predicted esterase